MAETIPRPAAAPGSKAARYLAALPDQRGRLAVVTGANGALGLEIARALALKGASVVMACRRLGKAEAARRELLAALPDAKLRVLELDLGSLDSVRAFAAAFRQRHQRLDLLFAHAGIMALQRRETADGFEAQLGVNHLGHFALTGLLLPALLAANGARVVATTSGAALGGRIDFDDLMGERRYDRWRAYGQAKLANVLFANALQRRLAFAGARASAHSAHPGFVHTDLQRNASADSGSALEGFVLNRIAPVFGLGPAMGALPMVYAGLSPAAQGGDLWGPRWLHLRGGPARWAAPSQARDRAAQERLWRRSEELTGVTYGLPAP